MAQHDPALIDFEASCLPEYGQSYPIEVAVARIDGESRSWLIKPPPRWQTWDWSEEAESLHGISRAMLACDGLPPAQVFAEMVAFVGTCEVYSDADLDGFWLEVLCEELDEKLPFPIRFLGEWMAARGLTREQVDAALEEARRRLPKAHHAREDAKRLALVVRLLIEEQPA
ncbi:3'-5' exonuclease [Novosphingobium sp. YAF33]|uniref:3'-5' exonuclease n=1 Tax=Novosphingobium sp. YAF33 TaxID=3233082 RepID=UPI003F987669